MSSYPAVLVEYLPHCLLTDDQCKVPYVAYCIYSKACIIKDFGSHLTITECVCNSYPVASAGKSNGIIFYFCLRAR